MDNPLFTRNQIESLGDCLLQRQPNTIVRHRLLRDVLRLSPDSIELETARLQMLSHPWVQQLAQEQQLDGTWGRFHTMDSSVKARFPTSEIAIRRALALGLDEDSPVLARSVDFMQAVLMGKAVWSDHVEKSEGWPISMEAITAGTLAGVDSLHASIRPAWDYWVEVVEHSFPDGIYNPSAEWQAHKELRGIGIHYLDSRYVLTLLGARSVHLPPALDRCIVDWIWNKPAGIGYLGADLQRPKSFHIFQWLESLEILSHFKSWKQVALGALAWQWDQRKADGVWDFGAKVSKSIYFPLSDNWQKAGSRSMDHSTRVLSLLRQFLD